MAILITGGAGYTGIHTVVQLIEQNFEVIVIDNLSNAKMEALRRVDAVTGEMPRFYLGNIEDRRTLQLIFQRHNIDTVIHLAGAKSAGAKQTTPLACYQNLLGGTLSLCETMNRYNVFKLVFSSSLSTPITGDNPFHNANLMVEQMLKDLQQSNPRWSIANLRHLKPAGAHYSGLIGDDNPLDSAIHQYVHISDLAAAQQKALAFVNHHQGFHCCDLTNTEQAKTQLDWVAEHSMQQIVRDHRRWQSQNPEGYDHCLATRPDTTQIPLKLAS